MGQSGFDMDSSLNKKPPVKTWLISVGAALVALVLLALIADRHSAATVSLSTDQNGVPQMLGIPLSNTNARDHVFSVLHAMGLKAAISLKPNSLTNEAQVSNLIEALRAINSAGLANPNQKPNPYE